MWQYTAKILRWVDGDTAWLDLDLGFRVHVEVDVRLARVNAPEVVRSGSAEITDKAYLFNIQHLPPGSMCVVTISKAEKFGRWLAEVIYKPGEGDATRIMQGGQNLSDDLLKQGFAVAYSGGRR